MSEINKAHRDNAYWWAALALVLVALLVAVWASRGNGDYERGVRDGFADLCVQVGGFINERGECEVEFPYGNSEGESR